MYKLSAKAALHSWIIVSLGALFYFYEYLLRTSPSVMTQELMRYYHLTGAQFGNLSGSFYYNAYVAMQIIVGLLMDRFGPRRLLTVACALCALGAYLFACSEYLIIAMTGRFLIGFGSAFAFVGAAKLATIWLPPERFAFVSGIVFCLGMLGAMFGGLVLHYLVQTIGWQMAIYGSAGVGVVFTIIIWMMVRDVNPYHVDHYSHHKPSLREVFLGLIQAVKSTQVWFVGMVGCMFYLFLSAYAELWAPSYLEQARGLSAGMAVSANSMVFLGCAIGAPLWGWFSDIIERRRLPLIISGTCSLLTICILLYVPSLSVFQITLLSFLFGFISSAQVLVFAVAREVTPIKISGTSIGLLNMLVMVGGIIFPPIVGRLLDLNWLGTLSEGARIYSQHAFTVALSVLPLGIMLGILITMFIRETYCRIYSEENLVNQVV